MPLVHNPEDNTIPPTTLQWSFGSLHGGGSVHFVLRDGGVRPIELSMNAVVLGLLANIRDGQVIPDP